MKGEISLTKDEVRKLGLWFTNGVVDGLCRWIVFAMVMIWVFSVALALTGRAFHLAPLDDTDKAWFVPSGLEPRKDALTGCEYLESSGGHLTPRLGADGRQVCRK